MLREDNHSAETRRDFPDEASVGSKPSDVAFIAAVEEDRAEVIRTGPVIGVNKVPLTESRELRREAEVIEILLEVANVVRVLRSCEMTRISDAGESSEESGSLPRRSGGGGSGEDGGGEGN